MSAVDPIVTKFMAQYDNLQAAADALGMSSSRSYLGKIARGQKPLSGPLKAKMLAQLEGGSPQIAENTEEVAGGAPPPLPRHYKNAPLLFKQYLLLHNNDIGAAAKAANISPNYFSEIGKRRQNFSRNAQDRIKAAMEGSPLPPVPPRGGHPNSQKKSSIIRTAVIIAKSELFETLLYDVGQTMGGEWAFKRKTGGEWIGVIQMAGSKLNGFLALATQQGAEHFTT